MQPIQPEYAATALKRFEGNHVYVHFEFPRGGFLRNLTAEVEEAHLRGDGPYRVALRCRADGWVIMEGLTHMAAEEGGRLFLGAFGDDSSPDKSDQRLSRALQISMEPFRP